jgi:hypothetical protein
MFKNKFFNFLAASSFLLSSCQLPGSSFTGTTYTAILSSTSQRPPNSSKATGKVTMTLSQDEKTASVTYFSENLEGKHLYTYILGPASEEQTSTNVIYPINNEKIGVTTITPDELKNLKAGLLYVNVFTEKYRGGEIRGQLK